MSTKTCAGAPVKKQASSHLLLEHVLACAWHRCEPPSQWAGCRGGRAASSCGYAASWAVAHRRRRQARQSPHPRTQWRRCGCLSALTAHKLSPAQLALESSPLLRVCGPTMRACAARRSKEPAMCTNRTTNTRDDEDPRTASCVRGTTRGASLARFAQEPHSAVKTLESRHFLPRRYWP